MKNLPFELSKDLISLEMLFNDLRRATNTRHPTNMSELKLFYKEKWSKTPPECTAGLIQSDWEHFLEFIAAGDHKVQSEINFKGSLTFSTSSVNV